MKKTTLIYSNDVAEKHGEDRDPREVIKELGIISADDAWFQTKHNGIKLYGVDPDTVPDPLPPFLRWARIV